jgi:hypothetical protein
VDEAQLAHDRGRQNERIEVRLARAVVQAVDRIGERQPRRQQRVEVALTVVQRARFMTLETIAPLRDDLTLMLPAAAA